MMIAAFKQTGRRNRGRFFASGDLCEHMGHLVRSLLGHKRSEVRIRRSEPLLDRA
jgi:hypothetical protein